MGIPSVDPGAPPNLRKRIITPVALTGAGRWFLMNVSRRVDPALVRMSGGRVSTVAFTPIVLLTTTGARSGLERTIPLLYFTDADRVVLIASNYGQHRHPAWYHNVKANPQVRMWAAGRGGRYVGHEATGEERARLFELATQLTEGYAQYAERVPDRAIPVLVFEPLVA